MCIQDSRYGRISSFEGLALKVHDLELILGILNSESWIYGMLLWPWMFEWHYLTCSYTQKRHFVHVRATQNYVYFHLTLWMRCIFCRFKYLFSARHIYLYQSIYIYMCVYFGIRWWSAPIFQILTESKRIVPIRNLINFLHNCASLLFYTI